MAAVETKATVESVILTLTAEEAEAVYGALDLTNDESTEFRTTNPVLYDVLEALDKAFGK